MDSLLIAVEAFGAVIAALYGCTLLVKSLREEFGGLGGLRAGRRYQVLRGV